MGAKQCVNVAVRIVRGHRHALGSILVSNVSAVQRGMPFDGCEIDTMRSLHHPESAAAKRVRVPFAERNV